MNRIDICKNIIQSIKEYITKFWQTGTASCSKIILSVIENYLFYKLLCIFCILLKLQCFKIYLVYMMTFQQLIFLLYQSKLYQRPDSLLAQIYLKNFIIFRLILFTVKLKIENFGMVIIFMLLMVPNSNFQIQNPILNFLVKCSDTLILPDALPWDLLLLYHPFQPNS